MGRPDDDILWCNVVYGGYEFFGTVVETFGIGDPILLKEFNARCSNCWLFYRTSEKFFERYLYLTITSTFEEYRFSSILDRRKISKFRSYYLNSRYEAFFGLENKNCWRTRLLKKRITTISTNFILNIRKCTMLNLSRLHFEKEQSFSNNYYYY